MARLSKCTSLHPALQSLHLRLYVCLTAAIISGASENKTGRRGSLRKHPWHLPQHIQRARLTACLWGRGGVGDSWVLSPSIKLHGRKGHMILLRRHDLWCAAVGLTAGNDHISRTIISSPLKFGFSTRRQSHNQLWKVAVIVRRSKTIQWMEKNLYSRHTASWRRLGGETEIKSRYEFPSFLKQRREDLNLDPTCISSF